MPDRSRNGLTTTNFTATHQNGDVNYNSGTDPIRLHREGINIGTWNVRNLYQCGKVKKILTHELQRYSCDIIELAEVRWTMFGETSTEERHTIWFSCDDAKHQYGIALLVEKEIFASFISCTPI